MTEEHRSTRSDSGDIAAALRDVVAEIRSSSNGHRNGSKLLTVDTLIKILLVLVALDLFAEAEESRPLDEGGAASSPPAI